MIGAAASSLLCIAQSQGTWGGLSFTEVLIILAVILIVVDFFLNSDVLTHCAYIALAFVIGRVLPFHILVQILIGLLAWFGLVWLHYKVWKTYIQGFANRVIAPDRYRAGAKGLVGRVGEIREVEDTIMVEVDGDLWRLESPQSARVGDRVSITRERSGVLSVRPVKESE